MKRRDGKHGNRGEKRGREKVTDSIRDINVAMNGPQTPIWTAPKHFFDQAPISKTPSFPSCFPKQIANANIRINKLGPF